jgi:hypothetical protein
VINAFQTAPAFKNFLVSSVMGEKIVAAHSLGNMVVSSAIADHDAPVDKYLAMNAAVSLEAFDETEQEQTEMIPSAWNGYDTKLRASEWFKLFEGQYPIDNRGKLTWRNRFANVMNVTMYNFYSGGDEVVSGAWQLQEKLKGFVPIISSDGGWKFNVTDYLHDPEYDIPPTEANALPDETLRVRPFFDKGGIITPLLQPGTPGSIEASSNRNELMARAFPATTWGAGREKSNAIDPENNKDMQAVFKTTKKVNGNDVVFWPRNNGRWFHSDTKAIAYTYTYSLFDNIVKIEKGILQ